MPSFNIFRTFGGSKAPPSRPAPVITKGYAYDTTAALSPISMNTMTHSRSASMPPEIIKSQPITDPSLGRRGTLKKKSKHRHHISEDIPMTPMQWSEPQYPPQDDLLPRPPSITAHQSSGYEPANTSASILPEEYPFPYEDNHQQRFQVNTSADPGAPLLSGMSGFESGPPTAHSEPPPPRGGIHPEHSGRHHSRHRHRHHRHHHQPQSPQQYEYEPSHAAPPTHGYGHSPPRHTSWEPDHSRSRSRSRSFTPIPSVYREPDSMDLGDSYADPMIRDNGVHLTGPNGHRRSPRHGPDGLGLEFDHGHGPLYTQQPAMIGWLPSAAERQMNEEPQTMHDSEATLVGEMEPQIISPPIESENPLARNAYRTSEPGYELNARHRRRRAPAQDYTYEDRRHGHSRAPEEPRKKVYMYRDHHYSETIEPRMYERRPSFDESDSDPEEYRYIVPSGVHVVFRDHDGNEIARIGEHGHISGGRSRRDLTAFTVQDEHGNILYRHGGAEGGRYGDDRYLRSGNPRSRRPVKVIMIDEHGNQVPLKSNESHSSRSHHSHRSHQTQHSQQSHHSHHSQHSQHSQYSQHSHHSQHSHPSQHPHHSQHSHPPQHLHHSQHSHPSHHSQHSHHSHHSQHSYPSHRSHSSGRHKAY